jgi:hypothetical protein
MLLVRRIAKVEEVDCLHRLPAVPFGLNDYIGAGAKKAVIGRSIISKSQLDFDMPMISPEKSSSPTDQKP